MENLPDEQLIVFLCALHKMFTGANSPPPPPIKAVDRNETYFVAILVFLKGVCFLKQLNNSE
jgi:hypothetical protein